jgi:hypothetical protein
MERCSPFRGRVLVVGRGLPPKLERILMEVPGTAGTFLGLPPGAADRSMIHLQGDGFTLTRDRQGAFRRGPFDWPTPSRDLVRLKRRAATPCIVPSGPTRAGTSGAIILGRVSRAL